MRSLPPLQVDHEAARARREQFTSYCEHTVASQNRGLMCAHASSCMASAQGTDLFGGQMGHVGRHYEVQIGDHPLRVLVVGQEFGRDPNSIPISDRSQTSSIVAVEERYRDLVEYWGNQDFRDPDMTPHIRGMSLAMRTIMETALTGSSDPEAACSASSHGGWAAARG